MDCNYAFKEHIDIFKQTNFSMEQIGRPEIGIIWDAFKAYIRGIMIGYSSKKKKETDR